LLHLAARLHAFVHGLFRPSDMALTRELFNKVEALARRNGVAGGARVDLAIAIAGDVAGRCGRDLDDEAEGERLAGFVLRLLDYEEMFALPRIDWLERRSVSEWWAIRDALQVQRDLLEDFDATRDLLVLALCHCCDAVWQAEAPGGGAAVGIAVPTSRVRAMSDLPKVVEAVTLTALNEELAQAGLLPRHRRRVEANVIAASGGNPADPAAFTRMPKLPTKSEIREPEALVETYLGGTPLSDLFAGETDFVLPTAARFEHHHIVAGSGHGKTQTLQYLIAKDLEAVARGARTVIVLDSQGDLIRNIARLKAFAPGQPLHDRIVLIDPTDVEWPVSLNLFDVGLERLDRYSQLDRERLTNSILELYDFVLGSLLAAEMTQKQNVIFRYVTRLMLHIPGATIHTLRELMEPGAAIKFADDITKLQGTARQFFETEFSSKEFEQTKRQVLRRLWGILENQTFERMFSHPRSKLDLFAEMNAGKVILINTAKDLLKKQGTEIFGRFFIAMIAQATQERATLAEGDRMPTFVYIDEAADYFDRNIGVILSSARKYNVGMVLAHQYLGQLEPKLQESFAANTGIKFAGGVSNRDARALALMLGCEPGLIEAQPKLSFAASIRGVTKGALPLQFPRGHLEAMERMTDAEHEALRDAMRARYAVHYIELAGVRTAVSASNEADAPAGKGSADAPKQPPPPKKPDDPDEGKTDPSPGW
jgi:hypothetical protein